MSTTTDDVRPSLIPKRGLAAALDFAAASHGRAGVLLLAFCLLAFLPGFFQIPPVDRDEARFAQATKQMVESGDYVDIRFQDEVRYKKPVGIYWMQAVAVKAGEALGVPKAHTTIWLYRLPSLLGRRSRRDYDCVVPVRGTPEYFKVLDVVKNELGLNPLVVAYNSQFNSEAGIENLDRLRDTFDVDLLHYTSNPLIYRKLVRESLARMRSMRKPPEPEPHEPPQPAARPDPR